MLIHCTAIKLKLSSESGRSLPRRLAVRGTDMTPSYTALYNKGSIYRGDTVAAVMWLKNPSGKKVYEFDIDIDQETGTVHIGPCPASVTEGFRPGTYYYDLEYTLESGRVRTYLKGQISILGDVSNVRP